MGKPAEIVLHFLATLVAEEEEEEAVLVLVVVLVVDEEAGDDDDREPPSHLPSPLASSIFEFSSLNSR